MHIKLCVDPVIPKRKKRKKNSAKYKNVDLYAFLADLKRDPLQHVCHIAAREDESVKFQSVEKYPRT